jgi:hypothetical protein
MGQLKADGTIGFSSHKAFGIIASVYHYEEREEEISSPPTTQRNRLRRLRGGSNEVPCRMNAASRWGTYPLRKRLQGYTKWPNWFFSGAL